MTLPDDKKENWNIHSISMSWSLAKETFVFYTNFKATDVLVILISFTMISQNDRFLVQHLFRFIDFISPIISSFLSFFLYIGKIGITIETSYPQAKTDSNDDKIASELALQFYVSETKKKLIK